MTTHVTGTGSLPEARFVVWACVCGSGQVIEYGRGFTEELALRVAAGRAETHRVLARRGAEDRS